MAFRHGYIFSTLRVAVMAVMLFFVIYFLSPGASMRFFGTSIKDSRVAEVTENAYAVILQESPGLNADDIRTLLDDPKVSQFIISSGLSASDAVLEVVAYVKGEAGETQ